MSEAVGLTKILHDYGGWGLAAVCFVVIWRLATYIHTLHKEQLASAREQTQALLANAQSLNANTQVLQYLVNKFEKGGHDV